MSQSNQTNVQKTLTIYCNSKGSSKNKSLFFEEDISLGLDLGSTYSDPVVAVVPAVFACPIEQILEVFHLLGRPVGQGVEVDERADDSNGDQSQDDRNSVRYFFGH